MAALKFFVNDNIQKFKHNFFIGGLMRSNIFFYGFNFFKKNIYNNNFFFKKNIF